MKALVTGMNGTVAPALARALEATGVQVVAWDRDQVPTDEPSAGRGFIKRVRPDWFFHVATGSPDWAEGVAHVCAGQGVRFLFTGSVSVFGSEQQAPLTVETVPQPDDDYGRYKLDCEQRVRAAHPDARVVRLAWQIGTEPGGNHMVDYLDRTARENGQIEANRRWVPACAFLTDTARALVEIMDSQPAGLYQLDGNPGLNFFQIATALSHLQGDPWRVVPTEGPPFDNRMMDEQIDFPPITTHFRDLPPR